MDLIGDEFAATDHVEKRINLATAGGTSKKGRRKKKLRGENNYMEPIDSHDESNASDSIGIFDDESRVEQELGIENFIRPVTEEDGLPVDKSMVTRKFLNESDEYFDFYPVEHDIQKLDPEEKFLSEGPGLKSILDRADRSSVINSDILSSDAQEFGFLKSGGAGANYLKEFKPSTLKSGKKQRTASASPTRPSRSKTIIGNRTSKVDIARQGLSISTMNLDHAKTVLGRRATIKLNQTRI